MKHKKRNSFFYIIVAIFLCTISMGTGCNGKKEKEGKKTEEQKAEQMTSGPIVQDEDKEIYIIEASTKTAPETETDQEIQTDLDTKQSDGETDKMQEKKIVVIDAGHQEHGNYEEEPIGPGASATKPKVASGTEGISTGIPEYQLNLEVSLKLQEELENRGYEVIMVRTKNEVNLSNAERAEVANDVKADVFLRIHANADDSNSAQGALTISPTRNNPYCSQIYEDSYRLSTLVLDELCKASGARKRSVWETDTMSGINWCKVPVTIVEMGFMSNPREDELLNSEEYQNKIVEGIANGVDAYCEDK